MPLSPFYKIAVLGAGEKPFNSQTKDSFRGVSVHSDWIADNIDIRKLPSTDIVQNLDKKRWDIPSDTYDLVIAEHIAEHMSDRIAFLKECRRIAKKDATVIIEVPNWKFWTAHATLEHKTTWQRCIFDADYTVKGMFEKKGVDYRIGLPFNAYEFYTSNGLLGRQLDRMSSLVSGLRFYLRVIK
jgi:predicted SAM-dependent methyltransferase